MPPLPISRLIHAISKGVSNQNVNRTRGISRNKRINGSLPFFSFIKNQPRKRYTLSRTSSISRTIQNLMCNLHLGPIPMKNLNVKTGSNQWTAHKSRQNYNQNFLQSLTKGIHGAMRQILKKENGPQGSDIVHKFLPLGAILEAPLYPYHSPKIQFADMDGDKAAELIATYRINGTLTTLILKNTEGEWRKVCEYTHPNCEVFNFRELADLTGEGRQHILMGLKSGTDAAVLYGYSLEEDRLQTLFTRNYHGLELMKGYSRKKGSARAQIAFWDHVENSAYDVHVCRYDGLQLSDIKNSSWYYQRRVLPYYSSRIRQSPQDPIHWFNLARILKTTGNIEASNLVIEEGMRVAKDFTMQQRFITLKRQGSQL